MVPSSYQTQALKSVSARLLNAKALVRRVQPAAEIVREINDEANAILRRLRKQGVS
jgi:hypothetical protein